LNFVDKNGAPFWSGAKRAPHPVQFDSRDPLHIDFVISAAFLRAYNFGIIKSELKPADLDKKIEYVKKLLPNIMVPDFIPKSGVKIQTDENNSPREADIDMTPIGDLVTQLPPPATLGGLKLNPVEFEKDDNKNFHIDFVSAAANLRATNYEIPTVDRLQAKLIAGRIIPAIITTTAVVTGLVCLELYKLVQGINKIESYRNSFVNLALPLFQQSEPLPPPKKKYLDKEFTLWDKIVVKKHDLTLKEFLNIMKTEYKLSVTMVGLGSTLLYNNFLPAPKKAERLAMKFTDLVPIISKKPVSDKQQYFILDITCETAEGEDIDDVPPIVLYFR